MLDEADEMLDMGFIDDITRILTRDARKPARRFLFSATLPDGVLKLQALHEKSIEDKDTVLDPHCPED